ncbi:hypothetical protein BT63DRAFT_478112 [Microthyrium microscopicum]|uniref:M protein repeat protein n=1 Tax=Microthyrium microscopicum TaxID=703497 RepID=A0A6A6UEG8_9PEZI|nr:hypothetical protein BT63DRAFT_478112 [Microthyrium microscopicum]
MAGEDDKEKAEKLAAAKKKYELMKKQKSKKAGSKKTEEKAEASAPKSEKQVKAVPKDEPKEEEPEEPTAEVDESKEEDKTPEPSSPTSTKNNHGRKPSVSQQSRIRSTSFKAGLSQDAPASPVLNSGPLSPAADAADIYRKQVQRIEELERENKTLQEDAVRLRTLEDEVQELRESNSDASILKAKADEADKLRTEVAALQRQNTQLTQQASAKKSRQESSSSPSADIKAELASKSHTIEALELDISSLNARLSTLQTTSNNQAATILQLESQLEKANTASTSATTELADLKAALSAKKNTDDSTTDLAPRVAQLEAELATAQRSASTATQRADTLDAKIAALATLHRDSDTRSADRAAALERAQRESKDLRTRLAALRTEADRLRNEATRRSRVEAEGDAAGLDELEDEERERLVLRVRELEAHVFELERGHWRDARRALQPTLDTNAEGAGFDDVDLSASVHGATPRATSAKQGSSFADVISSGISAFTGTDASAGGRIRGNTGAGSRPRKQSLGLMDDDEFEFDEDAFRKAQEEESKAQVERVREVKRGLTKWVGWRVDIADLRAGMGGVFDV